MIARWKKSFFSLAMIFFPFRNFTQTFGLFLVHGRICILIYHVADIAREPCQGYIDSLVSFGPPNVSLWRNIL